MKIINEKGKLFGIINIIDLAVLIVLVLIISAVGYKFLGNKLDKTIGTSVGTKDIIFTVKCQARSEATPKALRPGDKLVSLTSAIGGSSIVSVTSAPADITVTTSDGRVILSKDPIKKDIIVTIKMKSSTAVDILRLGTQDVAIGKTFVVKTQLAEVFGAIESIEIK